MKLTIVFTPATIATSPPLGIAYLKGYIESNSSHKVKCIDFCVEFYDKLLSNVKKNGISLYDDSDRDSKIPEILEKTMAAFRNGGDDFFDPGKYTSLVDKFLSIINKVLSSNEEALLEYITKGNLDVRNSLMVYVDRIRETKPDMVAFSLLYPEQILHTLAIAKLVKSELKLPIIFGGPTVSINPENFLKKCPFVDFAMYNEAENGIIKLLDKSEFEDMDFDKVPNLVWRRGVEVVMNDESMVQDISKLPFPDYSDIDVESYFCPETVFPVITSRGCYWKKCVFCAHHKSCSMDYRRRDIDNVIGEIKFLNEKYGAKRFIIVDEMISPARFSKLSDAILAEGLDITYYAMSKPIIQFSQEILDKAKKSGCIAILWGLESGSQRVLNLMNKGTKVEDISEVLKRSNKAGIKNFTFAFIGFPGETLEDFEKTKKFLTDNKKYIDFQFKGYFRVAEGSPLFEEPEKYGIKRIWDDGHNSLIPSYDYEVESGITAKDAMRLLDENYEFMMSLCKVTPFFGRFRDHMLVWYSNQEKS